MEKRQVLVGLKEKVDAFDLLAESQGLRVGDMRVRGYAMDQIRQAEMQSRQGGL